MNEQKLDRANFLRKKIEEVKKNLENWENSTSIYNGQVNLLVDDRYITTPVSPVSFTALRAINIEHWRSELKKLQEEFNEL